MCPVLDMGCSHPAAGLQPRPRRGGGGARGRGVAGSAGAGHLGCVRLLASTSGSDLGTEDRMGRTVVEVAAQAGACEVLMFLRTELSVDLNSGLSLGHPGISGCDGGPDIGHLAFALGLPLAHDFLKHEEWNT